ncbi:monocarboxylate transporter 14 [Trichonephila clavipes]|nr:monocarboxylate transporter 14 [Trichonephila clavipes]
MGVLPKNWGGTEPDHTVTCFGFGLLYLPTITSVAMHFENKRATAMGISSSGSGVGSLVLAPLTEWLIKYYYYWKGAFIISTGIIMQCFVLSLFYCETVFFVRRNEPEEESSVEPESDSSPISSNSLESNKKKENKQNLHDVPGKKPKLYYSSSISEQDLARNSIIPLSVLCPNEVKKNKCLKVLKNLYKMLGLSLLKNNVFLVFSLSRLLQYFGVMTPSVYLYDRAITLGIATSIQASFLISLIGISNTLGKILFGIFADLTSWNVLYIYAICLLINGISTMMTSLITHYYTMAIYSFVFGLTFGATSNLTSIVLVELFGLKALSNSYGLVFLFTGLAITTGSPVPALAAFWKVKYDISLVVNKSLRETTPFFSLNNSRPGNRCDIFLQELAMMCYHSRFGDIYETKHTVANTICTMRTKSGLPTWQVILNIGIVEIVRGTTEFNQDYFKKFVISQLIKSVYIKEKTGSGELEILFSMGGWR